MTGDTVRNRAEGPRAVTNIRRSLKGFDLDNEADDIAWVEVTIGFGNVDEGDARADDSAVDDDTDDDETVERRRSPGRVAQDQSSSLNSVETSTGVVPGRIQHNTAMHIVLAELSAYQSENADHEPTVEELSDWSGVPMSVKQFRNSLSNVARRKGLVDRRKDGHAHRYSMNRAGEGELHRLDDYDLDSVEFTLRGGDSE